MNSEPRLRELLDKYFAAETTLQEEWELRERMKDGHLPADLQVFQGLFSSLEAEVEEKPNPAVIALVMAQIEADHAQRGKIIPLHRGYIFWLSRVAAVAAILCLGLWWMSKPAATPEKELAQTEKVIDWSKYEPKTPEEAFKITHKALKKVAVELDKGTRIAENVEDLGEMGKVLQ
jgi:hypothetical protein